MYRLPITIVFLYLLTPGYTQFITWDFESLVSNQCNVFSVAHSLSSATDITGVSSFNATGNSATPCTGGANGFPPGRVGGNGGGDAYFNSGWPDGATENLSEYFSLAVNLGTNDLPELQTILLDYQRSNSGPQNYLVKCSLDGFTATLASGTWGSPGSFVSNFSINLDNINGMLNDISGAFELRIYCWNSTGNNNNGTIRFDNVKLIGLIALPVQLIALKAEPQKKKSMLSWSTAVEENNSHFLVQRSRDGVRYTNIGKVDGRGTVDFQNDYTFTDERPMSGVNYYRLQQVDFDGKSEYSPVVTATLRGLGAAVAPTVEVQESVTLTLEAALVQEGMVRILDASGRILSAMALAPGQDQYQIPTGHLPTGVYFLNIQADGETTQQKLLK